jgi:hypothetical protein
LVGKPTGANAATQVREESPTAPLSVCGGWTADPIGDYSQLRLRIGKPQDRCVEIRRENIQIVRKMMWRARHGIREDFDAQYRAGRYRPSQLSSA